MFEELLKTESSWDFLKSTPLPVVVYGTGNGADRVFEEFERLGITVSAVVASDGFVRSRSFRGFEVKSVPQAEEEYGKFAVALCFASPLPQVIESIKNLSLRQRLVMPSVPVYGENIFNKDFLKANLSSIERAYSLLCDEQSRKTFESIIRFQITGDLSCCFCCETPKAEAFSILNLGESESFLDLGAYRGDTVEEFITNSKDYQKIVAIEPDCKTFKKLQANCRNIKNFTALNNAIWADSRILKIDSGKGRGCSAKAEGDEIAAICVDDIFRKYGEFTYLNIDIEGAENEMLKGAALALKSRPKICMAAYHRSEDIFKLINKIHSINPDYRIYLRHHPHISFWDTNIYCV